MNYPAPTKIQQSEPTSLTFTWPDGSTCAMPLKQLRDECPCAGCKGENILGKVYKPVMFPMYIPGMYELKTIEPVGSYGIQVTWKDGHHTGIYTWEYLHLLCADAARQQSA